MGKQESALAIRLLVAMIREEAAKIRTQGESDPATYAALQRIEADAISAHAIAGELLGLRTAAAVRLSRFPGGVVSLGLAASTPKYRPICCDETGLLSDFEEAAGRG